MPFTLLAERLKKYVSGDDLTDTERALLLEFENGELSAAETAHRLLSCIGTRTHATLALATLLIKKNGQTTFAELAEEKKSFIRIMLKEHDENGLQDITSTISEESEARLVDQLVRDNQLERTPGQYIKLKT